MLVGIKLMVILVNLRIRNIFINVAYVQGVWVNKKMSEMSGGQFSEKCEMSENSGENNLE